MQNIKISMPIFILACGLFFSCKQNDLKDYEAGRYVQFDKNYQDTISVSFFLFPDKNEFSIALPLKLTGKMTTADLAYGIKVNAEASTAFPELYKLPGSFLFKKGLATDTAKIVISRRAELKGKQVLLVLDLAASNELMLGQTIYTRRVLKISDKIGKPAWWDATTTSTYLGIYTDKKFQTFIQVVGEGDLTDFSVEKRRDMMLEFKYYLIKMRDQGTPVLEDNGVDMLSTVPLIG